MPEQWVASAVEIMGDVDEAAISEDGDDNSYDDLEVESGLPDVMPLLLDELAEAHQPAVCTRARVPLRGVPASGSPGEGRT